MAKETDVIFNLKSDLTQFNSAMATGRQSIMKFAGSFVSLVGGTKILSGLGASAVKMGIDFDQAFAGVTTLFGQVEVNTDLLKQSIFELSNATGIAATELSKGLYQALSAGVPVTYDMAEAMNFLEQATKLSVAGFTSLPKAVDVATTVLNAFGLEIDEVDRVMNVLIETQNAGKTTVDELASSLGQAIPSAADLGINHS